MRYTSPLSLLPRTAIAGLAIAGAVVLTPAPASFAQTTSPNSSSVMTADASPDMLVVHLPTRLPQTIRVMSQPATADIVDRQVNSDPGQDFAEAHPRTAVLPPAFRRM